MKRTIMGAGRYLIPIGLYLATAMLIRIRRGGPDWDIFMQVTDQILSGSLLDIYSNRFHDYHTFAYPPLSVLVLAPFRLVSNFLRFPDAVNDTVVILPFLLADVACAVAAARWIDASGKHHKDAGYGVFILFLFAWVTTFSTPYHAHFESLLLLWVMQGLRAIQRNQLGPAALWFALALLTKQTAIAPLIAVGMMLLMRRSWRELLRFGVTLSVPVGLVLGPFLWHDPGNLGYMLFGLPAALPIAFQSSWWVLDTAPTRHLLTALAPGINVFVVLACCAYSAWAAWRLRLRHDDPRLVAICAINALIVVLLQKWGSLHYALLPFGLVLVAELLLGAGQIPWRALAFIGGLSNIFILFLSREVLLSFNATTAWIQIVLIGWVGLSLHRLCRQPAQPAGPGLADSGANGSTLFT